MTTSNTCATPEPRRASLAPAIRTEGFRTTCGDELVVLVDLVDDRLADLRRDGDSCSICRSSASMMPVAVGSRTTGEIRTLADAAQPT